MYIYIHIYVQTIKKIVYLYNMYIVYRVRVCVMYVCEFVYFGSKSGAGASNSSMFLLNFAVATTRHVQYLLPFEGKMHSPVLLQKLLRRQWRHKIRKLQP